MSENQLEDSAETASGDGPGKNGGSKSRSGIQYPYYGLGKALELVEAIRRAGGNEASNTAVMTEMGVKKVADRPWSYGVPAAIQFGLVVRDGRGDDGRLKLTDLAARIVLPDSDEQKQLALVAAFKTPELYSRLLEKYSGHPVPPKEGLRNLLQREYQIVESMALNAAEAFLESLQVAGLVTPKNLIAGRVAAPLTTNGNDRSVDNAPLPPGKTIENK